jgi:CheY-like chemotaxis protein
MADTSGSLLIVDDNKVNRLLLSRSVEMLGHRAEVVENGKQAMARLAEASFDLLLLDIEMPEMDGFEVLEALKSDPALRDLPVLVTSSVEGLENIVRCIELGAEHLATVARRLELDGLGAEGDVAALQAAYAKAAAALLDWRDGWHVRLPAHRR